MPLTYADALALAFDEGEEFTTKEFAVRIGSPAAGRVLSFLKFRGIVERTGRGRYRLLALRERLDPRSTEWPRVRSLILAGPEPKAWAGPSAVETWTGGAYVWSPSVVRRVFCVAVPESRLATWKEYLSRHRIASSTRKRVGARVELIPVKRLQRAFVDGEPVIPRTDVVRLIRDHPGLYAGAEELLLGRP